MFTGQSAGYMHRFGKVWKSLFIITSLFEMLWGEKCESCESKREKSLRSGLKHNRTSFLFDSDTTTFLAVKSVEITLVFMLCESVHAASLI